jgi:hypothetical protein
MRPRVTLRIDRIVADRPLGRDALAAALRAEIEAVLTAEGPAALGPGRALAHLPGRLGAAPAKPGTAERTLARATIGALRR